MREAPLIVACACLLWWSACHSTSPVAPPVPLNQRLTLAPGESVSIRDMPLRLAFLNVSGDSRCPADAFCIQGGDAIVHVRVTDDGSAEYELHTGDRSRASTVHAGVRIELADLQPYPFSSRTIDPADYRAVFTVSR